MIPKTHTVLPYLVSLIIAVAAMPTNVVLVSRDGMGIEHAQPWRSTSADGVVRTIRRSVARLLDSLRQLWGHPLRGPALACGAASLALLLSGVVDSSVLLSNLIVPAAPAVQRYAGHQAPGHIGQALLRSGMSIPGLRALSPLSEDAQKLVDQAVVRVGRDRLTIFADLLDAGLTFPLTNPLSVMEVQWETVSEAGGAQRTMLPHARGEGQQQDRGVKKVPVYLTTDDFSINIRTLQASERAGIPMDTSLVEQATRRVNEGLEDATINGAGVTVAGNGTPGLLNAPNVNTYQYAGGEAWDVVGHTGEEIVTDVLKMIDALQADKRFGPYNLYVNTTYGNKLNEDFKANSSKTILQRLQEISAGGRNLMVKTADKLPANRTILVQMTSDVVDIIDGQRPTVIPWVSVDGFVLYWMVLAIEVPRVRDDYDGKSGICTGNV